jgi:CRISPR-associated protein Cst1
MSSITLYPSNWLYNAGVIGLMRVLEELGEEVEKFICKDGIVGLLTTKNPSEIFDKWVELSPKSKEGKSMVYGFKNAYYANQTEKSIKHRIESLLGQSTYKSGKIEFSCSFCTSKIKVKKTDATFLNQAFGNILLGSEKSFSNMYWSNSASNFVCQQCEFIIMCHHLALTRLSDGSEIFINAPSFQVMYYLNKFAREVFGALSAEEMRSKRNILAMSVIEYAIKVQATLGVWTGMNIEIVSKYRVKKDNKWEDKIEFFSLPYEVIQLLSDRHIAGILSRIGEFAILNRVLDQDFSRLMETGYRLLRIGLKAYGERGKSENDFINQTLRLEKNRRNPARVAEQIFQLSALIEENKTGGKPMSTSTEVSSLEQRLEQLKEQLKDRDNEPNFNDFQKFCRDLQKVQRDFQNLLQWAVEDQRGKENEKEFRGLYRQVAGWNASDLMERLKRTGFALKKDRDLKDAIDRQGYRILELVRAGKRDEAFHAILRIFVSAKKDFPSQLVEAFKPIYSEELFKVFLFSFLSGILGKEEETEQETP